ncbi:MAG: sugar ABC transporter permease [Clostridia bacterium]|nr:sugar ABC transporter permease [Clostridia bacterium]
MKEHTTDVSLNVAFSKKNKKKQKILEDLFVASIVIWPLLLFVVYWIGGNITNIMLAFQEYNIEEQSFTFLPLNRIFTNFTRFFKEFSGTSGMGVMFGRSILYWFITFVMLIPHILVSFCIHKKVRGAGAFKIILFLPSVISSVVWIMLYRIFVEYGLPVFLGWFGKKISISLFMNSDTVFGTLVTYGIWLGFAGGLVLYTGAMSRIPPELVEAGKMDGMNTWQEFWLITMPLIFPTVSIGMYTGIVGIFTSSPSTYTFFGGNAPSETYTFGYYFFVMVFGGQKTPVNFPYASATSLIFTAFAAPTSLLLKHLCEKYGPNTEF